MNLAVSIQNVLLAAEGVTAIVGAGVAARIWNGWPRTQEVPCVVVEVDREEEQNDLAGVGELLVGDVTVTCRAATQAASFALWLAVRHVLAGYSGAFDLILDDTAQSNVPKDDGSSAHWYDHVMSYTALRTEAV